LGVVEILERRGFQTDQPNLRITGISTMRNTGENGGGTSGRSRPVKATSGTTELPRHGERLRQHGERTDVSEKNVERKLAAVDSAARRRACVRPRLFPRRCGVNSRKFPIHRQEHQLHLHRTGTQERRSFPWVPVIIGVVVVVGVAVAVVAMKKEKPEKKSAAVETKANDVFGNYRLLKLMATGQTSQVYEVVETSSGRHFAMKTLAARACREDGERRVPLP